MASYKVVIVGPASVGKTSIINYVKYRKYIPGLEPTVGASFYEYKARAHGLDVNIFIWDTAGSPRYHSIMPMYLREADAILLAFDVSNRETLSEIENYWLKHLELEIQNIKASASCATSSATGSAGSYSTNAGSSATNAGNYTTNIGSGAIPLLGEKKVIKYLIANKSDLLMDFNDYVLMKSQEIANTHGYRHFLTSAASGENIVTLFDELATALVHAQLNIKPLVLDDLVTLEEVIYDESKPTCSC